VNRGVLLYCFDTPEISYHLIANRCVRLIKKYLGLPITIITNSETLSTWQARPDCDFVTMEIDTSNTKLSKPWFNVERHMAYEHSPYDQTIVIDVDYFCFTNKLLRLLDTDYDFLIHRNAHDVTLRNNMQYNRESMIDLVWATVLIFKKTSRVKAVFDTVKLIKNNYSHFCNLYRISYANFRNDYAFAIALNQIGGFVDYNTIPDSMATVPGDVRILRVSDEGMTLEHADKRFSILHQDLHVINKEIANV
jgi:hypothetical protein